MDTLYQACVAAGIPTDNHESDLYIPATKATIALCKQYKQHFTRFVSQIDKKVWLDIFGAYDPFWEKKSKH